MSSLLKTVCLLSIFSGSLALQVTPGSKCAELCLDNPKDDADDPSSSTTNTTDITCSDSDYSTTGVGTKYKDCLSCLMTSDSVDESTSETDVAWFLYNLRYSIDVCLYGFGDSDKVSSPCDIDTTCLPLKEALLDGDLDPEKSTAYGYCDAEGASFEESSIKSCVSCLQAESDQKYLANFLVALQAGCEQKPDAGVVLGLDGDLFSPAGVNITEPVIPDDDDDDDGTGMTMGTIVGISVGAALLFIGGTALFFVYRRRQKKNHDNDARPVGTAPPRSATGSFHSYLPDHKKSGSLHSETEMKFTRPGDSGHAPSSSFSSNADFYDKVEEAMQMGFVPKKKKYALDPHKGALNPATALPTHPAYITKAMSRSNTPSPIPPLPTAQPKTSPGPSPRPSPRPSPLPLATATPPTSPPTRPDARSSVESGTGSGTGPKRANRPAPLQNISSHQKSSSYTLQKYLNNSEDTPIPIPPPPPMTGRSLLSQQSQQSQVSNRSNFSAGAAHGTMTSQGPGTSGQTLSPPLPPLPPPPSCPPPSTSMTSPKHSLKEDKTTSPRRIPQISLPSVPRIKVPKKYSPPNITVQGATPIEANDISGPMDPRASVGMMPRFHDNSFGDNAGGPVIERQVPLPSWRRHEAEEVQTGRSAFLYG
ncbi:hypothetical protein MKZ38_000840 [Zalerion maritima]|uniref:Exo-alpha-sialidase / neuraminidase n=1 Tax=Zalerion maritima TaxID=339359 RepID=A0AAD5RXR0_9PEZI|nr:hypothetical protein MKZ38_000840 [Zalerion maritima]